MNHKIQSCTSMKTKFITFQTLVMIHLTTGYGIFYILKALKLDQSNQYLSAFKKKKKKKKNTKNELACQYLTYDEETVIKESVTVSAAAYRTSFSKSICLMEFFFLIGKLHTPGVSCHPPSHYYGRIHLRQVIGIQLMEVKAFNFYDFMLYPFNL